MMTKDCNVPSQHNPDFYLKRYLFDRSPAKLESGYCNFPENTCFYLLAYSANLTCLASIMGNDKICF